MKRNTELTSGGLVTRYPTTTKKYLLYLHGGGLVYGSRSDIPEALVEVFQKAGYTLLTLDYLLAPNSSLPEIIANLWDSFVEIKETIIGSDPYSFCGRSAGGYLMFLLTKKIQQAGLQAPASLVNFYGYYDLAFIDDKRALTDQSIPAAAIAAIDQKTPLWDDPFLQRYLLYLYGVENQLLSQWYGVTAENLPTLQLTDTDLATLPPLFSSASTADGEVPFRYSKTAAKKNPQGKFVPVYYLEHDFLKATNELDVQKVLKSLAEWLKE